MIVKSNRAGNITLLISTLGGGGAERVCVLLANGLVCLGWQVDLVILKQSSNDRSAELSDGVNLVCLGVTRARYAPKALLRYLESSKPAILLSFNNEVAIAEFLISLIRKRTYRFVHRNVTTLSSVLFHSGGGLLNKLRYWLLKKVLRQADLVVSQCEEMANDANKELGLVGLPYIYNPVVSRVTEPSTTTDASDVQFILCAGRIDRNKSFGLAVEALSLLPKTNKRTELWIAGEGPEKSGIERLAEQLGIKSRVRFLGYSKDLDNLYTKAALVSLTSHFEGFPNILIESISNGCPIVSVDCPSGPSEIVEEGMNGFLVKDRTPEALAEAYEKALKKDWSRVDAANTADKFSGQKILQQWDETLQEQLSLLERGLKCQ